MEELPEKEVREIKEKLTIKCSDCGRSLLNVITIKDTQNFKKIKADCPHCNGGSFNIPINEEFKVLAYEGLQINESHYNSQEKERHISWVEKCKVYYYDENGFEHQKEPKNIDVYAKKIVSSNEEQYLVWARSGRLYKHDLDPKEKRKDGWRFIILTKMGFYNYINYLKSKNESSYILASREV